ncbi:MAG: rubredoxin, partial [Alistipes sp.]|nr:rubredoxin [Alistipes sp.]
EAIENGKKIATLGDVIHNRQVMNDLSSKGVYSYDSVEDIPEDWVCPLCGVGKDEFEVVE